MAYELPESLERIYRTSIKSGSGLPGEVYTDEGIFAWERLRLFHRSWFCIGLEHDVAEPGDVQPVTYAGVPLLLVRDYEGALRVFHNTCPHRGSELVEKPRNCRRKLVCPYHGWAFSLSGELARTPHAGGAGRHAFDGVDPQIIGLSRVRHACWCGLVFVNLSGQATSFEEYIQPVLQRLGDIEAEEPRYDTELATEMTLQANWKLVVENFVESYHVPSVHPELEKINPMKNHYQILGGFSYVGQGGEAYAAEARSELAGLPLRKQIDVNCYEALYIFPNLIIGPLANFMFVIIVDPLAANETRERLEYAFYTDEALTDGLIEQRKANAEFLRLVNRQDIVICEKVQRGRRSPAFSGGLFALPQETTSLLFLNLISARKLEDDQCLAAELVNMNTRDIHHEP